MYSSSELQLWQMKFFSWGAHSSWTQSLHVIHLIHVSPALLLEQGSTQVRQNHSSSSDDSIFDLFFFECRLNVFVFSEVSLVLTFFPFLDLLVDFFTSSSNAFFSGVSVKMALFRFFPSFVCLLSRWGLRKRPDMFWCKCFRHLNRNFLRFGTCRWILVSSWACVHIETAL